MFASRLINFPIFPEQLHTFPEGKVSQQDGPIRRLKWGTASLIVRAPVTPIILPIFHHGFHKVKEMSAIINSSKRIILSIFCCM